MNHQRREQLATALLFIAEKHQTLEPMERGAIADAGEFLRDLEREAQDDEPSDWDTHGYNRR